MAQFQTTTAVMWLVLAGEANAHDWYTGKTDPVLHYDCCGNKDCHPIDPSYVRMTKDGYFVSMPRPTYLNEPQEAEWFIPRERVQAAPDDRYHICERLMTFYRTITPHMKFEAYQRFRWTCFFAPPGTSSIAASR
ncbi:hypothetical protein [Mesorhizobium sp.]|uniref:hypothetical protein n=1 Tax=Mesorhizobium sp. TaxID=1871066 RepID=UPI000FE2BCC3|nr:hypothetical protein [Mesorhizobium sp.]RWA70944.1 MAG: hypothetical protein EOQ28_19235 [Mesorhizobium sp.]RWB93422.1 MAG: hypothetical protein EOQ57_34325 [Mesorhizobium sp.]RWG81656.1 MAG: hypothetical protein EOQ69_17505 [Mesorhizobium sp.]RWG83331.1 MAG: hypothetical protein EOQ70_21100 [Mesorhizobium sp.]RWK08196.1 MAG: hypothetical protein EOR42_06565 [Mesorhizobium sp.]